MIVPPRIDNDKPGSKRFAQAFGVMPRDRQPAALLRAVKRESADDGVAAGPQRAPKPGGIGGLIGGGGQKVERRPVMPNIKGARRRPCRHIGDEPMNLPSLFANASLCRREGRR